MYRIINTSLLLLLVATAPAPSEGVRTNVRAAERAAKKVASASLCDPGIVAETCALFSPGEAPTAVAMGDLQEMLSAADGAMDGIWAELGFSAAAPVSCTALCRAVVVELAKTTQLPPAHDVGCIYEGEGVVCDVDLGPGQLDEDTKFEGDLPDFHDQLTIKGGTKLHAETPSVQEPTAVEYTSKMLLRRLANLFRIFPVTGASVAEDSGPGSLAEVGVNKTEGRLTWIRRVNLKAMRYVQKAIRRFRQMRTTNAMTKWFGAETHEHQETRDEVQRVLNAIDAMLDNVEYVYPGPDCEADMIAYVYPDSKQGCARSMYQTWGCTTNNKGQFVFYICELAKTKPLPMQIEMLTHEGSHHATAYTRDVCLDEGYDPEDEDYECQIEAYGRRTCENLAQKLPDKALKNADNFCYYIQDVNDEKLRN